jgi:uncharacterized protein (DUF427 family)
VLFNGVTIAESRRAWRVLETSHPPVYYIPPEDVRMEFLRPVERSTLCEWKGRAAYYTVAVPSDAEPTQPSGAATLRSEEAAAWCYPQPTAAFAAMAGAIAFYPSRMGGCFVNGEAVQAQPGDFYGGWITSRIVGPFKGSPGTWGW